MRYPKYPMWNRVKERLVLTRIYGSLSSSLRGLGGSVSSKIEACHSGDQVIYSDCSAWKWVEHCTEGPTGYSFRFSQKKEQVSPEVDVNVHFSISK